MIKRSINSLRIKAKQFGRHCRVTLDRHDRIIANALRMARELAQSEPLLVSARKRQSATPAATAEKPPASDHAHPKAADYKAEIDRELDRVFEGRPREPQRGGRRIVLFTSPGGNS